MTVVLRRFQISFFFLFQRFPVFSTARPCSRIIVSFSSEVEICPQLTRRMDKHKNVWHSKRIVDTPSLLSHRAATSDLESGTSKKVRAWRLGDERSWEWCEHGVTSVDIRRCSLAQR